jgi:hypothetical protein
MLIFEIAYASWICIYKHYYLEIEYFYLDL